MADEAEKIILADTAVSAIDRSRRGFFRRRKIQQSPPPTHCENCRGLLHGHWCAQCGQAAIDYRRSFRHVIGDVLDSFLNWDSKFFATIGLLIAKPWSLTNAFLSGKRVRYVHPLRLYLLASILFFFAVNYWARAIHVDPSQLGPKDRAQIEAELQNKDLPPKVREQLQAILREPLPTPAAESEAPRMDAGPKERPFLSFDDGTKAETPLERWLELRAKEKFGEHGTRFALFIKALVSNLPYMMLCCIPLFAFVLKILYLRRRIFYIDHLVYALHIHTFAYMGVMLIVLVTIGLNHSASGRHDGWLIALLWCAFVAQIFLSIRRVYRQSWFISVLKFLFGGLAYLIVLSVALAVTFFITLALPTS
ncbi:MAG TPA: DUF3667 domain-containing protein [Chthoniobacterales bacterium]|nr:DUF3667 domain-containing protein [Chthoniobacterales bacterium]